MKFDNEFKNLIPPLTEDEYKQLEENILRDGIIDPLVVWAQEEILVDGHNRYEIAQKHNLYFATKYVDFKDRDEAMLWIIDNQNGRRNLVKFQKIELELRKKEILGRMAKDKEHERKTTLSKSTKSSAPPMNTRKEIAKSAGVAESTVRQADYILNKGSEEIKQLARSGQISTNEAYKRTVKENMPPKPDIPSVKEEREAFKAAPVVSMDDIEIDKNNKRIIAIDLHQAILKTADSFEKLFMNERPAELAEDAEGLTNEERAFLTARMYSIRNCVDSIIKILRGEINGKR